MDKKRCVTCNKKLGVMKFLCKCGAFTCSKHRDVSGHDCDFDFHQEMKQKLEKTLVKTNDKQQLF